MSGSFVAAIRADFRTEYGSSQGQYLALTGLLVPCSLHSGVKHIGLADAIYSNGYDLYQNRFYWRKSTVAAMYVFYFPWGGVPREQKMLQGHLPRVIHHRVYSNVRK